MKKDQKLRSRKINLLAQRVMAIKFKKREEVEKRVDQRLEQTFPASDPPVYTPLSPEALEYRKRKKREEMIDHELEDTFPASDPTSFQTGGSKPG